MSVILCALGLIAAIWLIFKIILVEIPSPHTVIMMRKIHGPNSLPFFLGELLSYMRLGHDGIFDYIKEVTVKYPRISGMYVAGIPLIFVQKAEDMKHILSSNTNIQKGFHYVPVLPWLKEGLLTSSGAKWHQRRKMLTPAFHYKILDDALPGIAQNTTVLTNRLSETNGRDVHVHDYVTRCTLDIIGDSAMGVHLGAQTDQGSEYLSYVLKATKLAVDRFLNAYQIRDIFFYFSSTGLEFRKCLKVLHGYSEKIIADRKKVAKVKQINIEDIHGRKKKQAFLDCLLDMQAANPEDFTDKDIREEVDTFMFEGFDTSATAICFGLWLLGHNQDVQEKLYQDVMDIIGQGEITMQALSKMHYLERIIKETLRMYPSVPLITRVLSEDVILDDGTVLPASANVVMMPYYLHRDPEYFPEPEKFDPERFTEEASLDRHPYAYIPFSAGPRNCVGQKFAMLEMKTAFVSVIRKLKINSITEPDEFKVQPDLTLSPNKPLICTFTRRE